MDQNPERLLSAALRAQAAGGGRPDGTPPPAPQPSPGPPAPRRDRLPVVPVLVFAVLLGAVAGGVLGVVSAI